MKNKYRFFRQLKETHAAREPQFGHPCCMLYFHLKPKIATKANSQNVSPEVWFLIKCYKCIAN